MSTEEAMTIVIAVIKPPMEGRVVRALNELAEFLGFTVAEVRGRGAGGRVPGDGV